MEGGYSPSASNAESSASTQQAKPNITTQALSFSFGLATTLAGLGLLSSSVGLAYGQIGEGLPLLVSLLAIAMGLNLLQVLPLRLPSLDLDVRELTAGVPPALQAYLAGLAFALAASPCATPVLATLLAWVANTGDPVQGAALLLAYTSGYVAPLLLAATVTGSMKQLLSLRQYSAWVTPASGSLLVAGGTFSLLTRLF
ncbi:DsbD domain-containing protein [Haematococcus lacustris]|uniref:DsbD domain-containing protein n=1 Tax=Haematococcus lacustris TaxID=44745 RepID=A0A699Z313_HAELA|nr:DsbD domain-containing protein [Haematococcus lacustris]